MLSFKFLAVGVEAPYGDGDKLEFCNDMLVTFIHDLD